MPIYAYCNERNLITKALSLVRCEIKDFKNVSTLSKY